MQAYTDHPASPTGENSAAGLGTGSSPTAATFTFPALHLGSFSSLRFDDFSSPPKRDLSLRSLTPTSDRDVKTQQQSQPSVTRITHQTTATLPSAPRIMTSEQEEIKSLGQPRKTEQTNGGVLLNLGVSSGFHLIHRIDSFQHFNAI